MEFLKSKLWVNVKTEEIDKSEWLKSKKSAKKQGIPFAINNLIRIFVASK